MNLKSFHFSPFIRPKLGKLCDASCVVSIQYCIIVVFDVCLLIRYFKPISKERIYETFGFLEKDLVKSSEGLQLFSHSTRLDRNCKPEHFDTKNIVNQSIEIARIM